MDPVLAAGPPPANSLNGAGWKQLGERAGALSELGYVEAVVVPELDAVNE